ncbi:MAG: type IX secretion system membrane protein PorP/SprF [Bacteroidales bacterium]|nr:type IX secretion system membrane protein PorP/SprF [Bacteroidales bacterium]
MNYRSLIKKSFWVFLIAFAGDCFSQDFSSGQYYLHDTYYNPAMSGSSGTRLVMTSQRIYRDQNSEDWTSFLSFDKPLPVLKKNEDFFIGPGFSLYYTSVGPDCYSSFVFSPMFSINTNASRYGFLRGSLGFKLSLAQKNINYDNLYFSDQLHPIAGIIKERSDYLSISPEDHGLALYYGIGTAVRILLPKKNPQIWRTKILLGAALDNYMITGSDDEYDLFGETNYYKYSISITAINELSRDIGPRWIITPGFLYNQYRQEEGVLKVFRPNPVFESAIAGTNLIYILKVHDFRRNVRKAIFAGMWVRNQKNYTGSTVTMQHFDWYQTFGAAYTFGGKTGILTVSMDLIPDKNPVRKTFEISLIVRADKKSEDYNMDYSVFKAF